MLTLEPARTDQHYASLLDLIFNQSTGCLKPIYDLAGLTWDQFGRYFRTTGIAYLVLNDEVLVGVCWVQIKAVESYLLGLIIKPEFQGQGIGAKTLTRLETNLPPDIHRIKLQVHYGNTRAQALYRRMGYHIIKDAGEDGFYWMQKTLRYNSRYGRVQPGLTRQTGPSISI